MFGPLVDLWANMQYNSFELSEASSKKHAIIIIKARLLYSLLWSFQKQKWIEKWKEIVHKANPAKSEEVHGWPQYQRKKDSNNKKYKIRLISHQKWKNNFVYPSTSLFPLKNMNKYTNRSGKKSLRFSLNMQNAIQFTQERKWKNDLGLVLVFLHKTSLPLRTKIIKFSSISIMQVSFLFSLPSIPVHSFILLLTFPYTNKYQATKTAFLYLYVPLHSIRWEQQYNNIFYNNNYHNTTPNKTFVQVNGIQHLSPKKIRKRRERKNREYKAVTLHTHTYSPTALVTQLAQSRVSKDFFMKLVRAKEFRSKDARRRYLPFLSNSNNCRVCVCYVCRELNRKGKRYGLREQNHSHDHQQHHIYTMYYHTTSKYIAGVIFFSVSLLH